MSVNNNPERKKSIRGFAAMDAEKQKEIARKGGRAAHEQGVAHEWSSQEARDAGKKGGGRLVAVKINPASNQSYNDFYL